MRNPNAEILEYVLKFLFSLAIIGGISVVVSIVSIVITTITLVFMVIL